MHLAIVMIDITIYQAHYVFIIPKISLVSLIVELQYDQHNLNVNSLEFTHTWFPEWKSMYYARTWEKNLN